MVYLMYFLYIVWEFPQNLLGLLCMIWLALSKSIECVSFEKRRIFMKVRGFAVSLGIFIFWSSVDNKHIPISKQNKLHEYGHSIQSRMLGPLYLLVVGLPSILRVIYGCIYHRRRGEKWQAYYDGYPEKWADRLGNVQ